MGARNWEQLPLPIFKNLISSVSFYSHDFEIYFSPVSSDLMYLNTKKEKELRIFRQGRSAPTKPSVKDNF